MLAMNKTFSSQTKRITGGNATTALPSLAIDKFIDTSVQEWSQNSKGYPAVTRGSSRISSNGIAPPIPQPSSRIGHSNFQFTPMKNTEKRVYRTIDADDPQIPSKPQSSHTPYLQSVRPPLKQLQQNQDFGFLTDEQYSKYSQSGQGHGIVQSVKNQPNQRYRALSLNGVMSKQDGQQQQQILKPHNLLPATPSGIKTKKETCPPSQKVTKYNDIRAIQFLGAYGDHKIGEVKITNEELKEFLKRLGNPESYDGRIMFKHFMDHFREWIKRMTKIASELREKLFMHDFSESTDFSEIVMDCSRHCGDIIEVIESARCVQERYSQNQSLEKVLSQLQKRQESFRELKESCEVLTTVQAELEGVVLASEGQQDKVEEIIRKGKQKIENGKHGLNRHLDRMEREFEMFQELMKELETAKEMNISNLMEIAGRLQRAKDESIFLPLQAKERLEQHLQSITVLIKQVEDKSKENSLKYLTGLINQVRKRIHLNLHKEEFEEQLHGIKDTLNKLKQEIVFERESEGISKAEMILKRIDQIFKSVIVVLKSEQYLSNGEVNIANHNCREAIKQSADYSQQLSQNIRSLVQLFRFLKQNLENDQSTYEIKNHLEKPRMIECESDMFLNNDSTTQSSSFYHPSVASSIPQSVHNLNRAKGESDCDSVNNDMPSSNSYCLSQYEPNETVPQQSQISRHAYGPATLNRRNKNRVITLRRYIGEGERSNSEMDSTIQGKAGILNRQCRFLEVLAEQCQEQEKQEIELGIDCNPFQKLLSTYENHGEDRNELIHRVQTDYRVLQEFIRKSESGNTEGSLSEEIQELFGNYLKRVTLWHANNQEIEVAKKLKEVLNSWEEKTEVVAQVLKEVNQNAIIKSYLGEYGLREITARVARLAIEKSISVVRLITVEESLQSAVARMIEGARQLSISHLPFILAADCNSAQQLLPFIKDYQGSFNQLLQRYHQTLLKTTAYNYLLGESSVISPNFASIQQPLSQLFHLIYSPNNSNPNESASIILTETAGKIKDTFLIAKRNFDEIQLNLPDSLQQIPVDPQQMTVTQAVKLLDPKVKQIFQRKVERVIEGCTIKASKSDNIQDPINNFSYIQRQKMILSIIRRLGEYFEAKNENVIILKDTHHKIVFICKHNQRDFTHPFDRFQSTQQPSIITDQLKNYPEIYKQIVLNSVFFHSITQNPSLHKQQLDQITYDPRQNQREGTQILCTSKGSFFLSDHGVSKPVVDILTSCSCKLIVTGKSIMRESKLFEIPLTSELTEIKMPLQLEDIAQMNISLFCQTHQQIVMSSNATVYSFLNSLFEFSSDLLKQSAIFHLQSLQINCQPQIEALQQLTQQTQQSEEYPIQQPFPQLINSVNRRSNSLNPIQGQPQETMFAYRSSLNAIEEESYCLTQLSMTKNNPHQSPSDKHSITLLCQESAYLCSKQQNLHEENQPNEQDNRQNQLLNNPDVDNNDALESDRASEHEEQEILGQMNQIHRQWEGLFGNDSKIEDISKQKDHKTSFDEQPNIMQQKQENPNKKNNLNHKKETKSFRCVVEELKHTVFEI